MNRLKELRNEFGYSIRELADILKFNRSSLSYYENEDRNMNVSILLAFSQLFQVTVDYIICNSDLGIYAIDENNNKILLNEKEFKKALKDKKIAYKEGIRYLTK